MFDKLKVLFVANSVLSTLQSIDSSLKELAKQGSVQLRLRRLELNVPNDEDLSNLEKTADAKLVMQSDEEMADLEEAENEATKAGRRPAMDEMPIHPWDFPG